jgi:GABA(A) receptor-associated protein
MNFKSSFSLEKRKELSNKIFTKYKDKIPIIIQSKNIKCKKIKFLVHKHDDFSFFLLILRKFIEIQPDDALFTFINDTIPVNSESVGSIYKKFKDEDGFLYVNISLESTFGFSKFK